MQHFFPFIVLAIVLISKIISNANKQSGGPPVTPRSTRRPPGESEEERLRRFREAVGLPPDAAMPPPVRPRPATRPAPMMQVPTPSSGPSPLRRVPPSVRLPAPDRPVIQPPPPRRVPAVPAPVPPIVVTYTPPPPPSTVAATAASRTAAGTAIPAVAAIGAPLVPGPAKTGSSPAAALLARMRDPQALRDAIVLREVLGPPKAFRSGYGGAIEIEALGR